MSTEKKTIRNERFNLLLKERFGGIQADMANELDISPSLIWRYAKGIKGIGEDMKNRIERILELNSGWLDGSEAEKETKIDKEDEKSLYKMLGKTKETLSMGQIERLQEFINLSIEQQEKALDFAKEKQTGRGKEKGDGTAGG